MIPVSQLINQQLPRLPVDLDPRGVAKLEQFVALMVRWNKVHNLTAIRDTRKIVIHHVFDSLAIAHLLKGTSVIDVGSGAGLPGIPLAVSLPEKSFTLLDSNVKKTAFLNQVVASLELNNVRVVHTRVEAFVNDTFDHVLCRAFAGLEDIALKLAHLVNEKGNILAMKSKHEEICEGSGFQVLSVTDIDVPLLDADRCVIELGRCG